MHDLQMLQLRNDSVLIMALDSKGVPHLWDKQKGKWVKFVDEKK